MGTSRAPVASVGSDRQRLGAAARPTASVPIVRRSGPLMDDDGVAHRDPTVVEDVGIEPGPVDQLLDDPRPRQLLQVQARLAQLDPEALNVTDPKALANKMTERDAAGGQIASMIIRRKCGFKPRDLWLTFGHRLENLDLDQRDVANIGFR